MAHPEVEALRSAFPRAPGYLDAATMGLPALATSGALREALAEWESGRARAGGYDEAVDRSRAAYARLVGVDAAHVAVGAQASVMTAVVAGSLPDGAEVLTYGGEFTSVLFPFLVQADRGVRVRTVPLEALADEVGERTACVAFSLVQSSDGRVADLPAVREAAAAVGALTFVDVTQAAGWLPVRAAEVDVSVCSAYKWLCAPRGTAFLTVRPQVAGRLRPAQAGWYAGESVWSSVYGPGMDLARSARRFDVSPAWLSWVGAAPVLELFARADLAAVHRHDVALADTFGERLGLTPAGSAIVSIADEGGVKAALDDSGCVVAGRAGRVRLAFHVWNDEDDVERAVRAVLSVQEGRGAAAARRR